MVNLRFWQWRPQAYKKRQDFKNHITTNAAAVALQPDELRLLLAMVDVYNLHHKRDLMLQLDYFAHYEPRLDVLTQHLRMSVPNFKEFRQMIGRIKRNLPNF